MDNYQKLLETIDTLRSAVEEDHKVKVLELDGKMKSHQEALTQVQAFQAEKEEFEKTKAEVNAQTALIEKEKEADEQRKKILESKEKSIAAQAAKLQNIFNQ